MVIGGMTSSNTTGFESVENVLEVKILVPISLKSRGTKDGLDLFTFLVHGSWGNSFGGNLDCYKWEEALISGPGTKSDWDRKAKIPTPVRFLRVKCEVRKLLECAGKERL